MTPYEKHGQLNHKMTRYSPDGFVIIEECENCGMRFLHNPLIGYPVTLTPNIEAVYKLAKQEFSKS